MTREKVVFCIVNRETGMHQGVYSRANPDEYDFASASHARSANCHDIYEDREIYKINKYKVTYTLIEDDVD